MKFRKFFHSKLKSSFEKKGQHGEENVRVKTVINEEYRKAFRTKSYTEICEKIQARSISLDDDASSFSSSPAAPTTDRHVDLSEYLVELRRETLVIGSSKNHLFLTNYYDVTLEAGRFCELILLHSHQLRDNYRMIRRVINFIEKKPDYKIWSQSQQKRIHRNLESFNLNTSTNPFSSMEKFVELHDIHRYLFDQLTSKTKKTTKKKKKKRIMKCIKRALAILGCTALAVALLFHTAVGVAAAGPGLIVSSLALFSMKKKLKRTKRETNINKKVAGVEAQIEEAGRGIYVVMNEFETMRQLVQRLHDEMEHWKAAAETGVRTGKKEALKQVVRGFKMHECCFVEQLEELEKQICLCFLHINRSRRLIIQQLDK